MAVYPSITHLGRGRGGGGRREEGEERRERFRIFRAICVQPSHVYHGMRGERDKEGEMKEEGGEERNGKMYSDF